MCTHGSDSEAAGKTRPCNDCASDAADLYEAFCSGDREVSGAGDVNRLASGDAESAPEACALTAGGVVRY
jgi:hypothetical protein